MNIPQSMSFLSPEEIATREMAQHAGTVMPNLSTLFKDREIRLRQLAAGHSMRDFLIFMADLASAQHRALNDPDLSQAHHSSTHLPELKDLQAQAQMGLAPLDPKRWSLASTWTRELEFILRELERHLSEQTVVKRVIDEIRAMSSEQLNQQAQCLLLNDHNHLHMGAAPLIASALQVLWVRLAASTSSLYPEHAFPAKSDASACPCCGSKPVASLNRLGSDVGVTRYLNCSLCQTQWHMTRIKCAHCQSTQSIAYHSLVDQEGHAVQVSVLDEGGVSLETCDECHHYLKIVNMAKDVQVEPVADDLATLTLDLLIAEQGYERAGLNFMMLFGRDEAEHSNPSVPAGDPR
jgi:FdhE protein